GLHWSTKEFKGFDRLYYALTWNGRAFVAAGPSSFAISADGASWRILSFEGLLLYPSSIAGDNGRTVFTGSPNYRTPSLFVSPDGTEWYVAVAPLVLAAGEARAASLQPLAAVARDEGEELAHEERRNFAASALIGFALSGVGILLYVGLQAWALWRMRGGWRLVAALPALFMALVLTATIAGYAQRSNLWPLLLIFGLPLAVACLLVLLLVWLGVQWLAAKAGRR
ncbi:MAG: hypothetical protein L0099_08680, partial [Acidobacteria bacterium]|nr:hypothetical protein [Acidobacteriota bacterium]